MRLRCRHCRARHSISFSGEWIAQPAPTPSEADEASSPRKKARRRRVSLCGGEGEVLRDVVASLLDGLTHAGSGYTKLCVAQQRKPTTWATFQVWV